MLRKAILSVSSIFKWHLCQRSPRFSYQSEHVYSQLSNREFFLLARVYRKPHAINPNLISVIPVLISYIASWHFAKFVLALQPSMTTLISIKAFLAINSSERFNSHLSSVPEIHPISSDNDYFAVFQRATSNFSQWIGNYYNKSVTILHGKIIHRPNINYTPGSQYSSYYPEPSNSTLGTANRDSNNHSYSDSLNVSNQTQPSETPSNSCNSNNNNNLDSNQNEFVHTTAAPCDDISAPPTDNSDSKTSADPSHASIYSKNSNELFNSKFLPKDLFNSNFVPKDLSNSNFMPKDLSNSNFIQKNLSNSNFVPKDLFNSNFMPKDLPNSNFVPEDLFNSNFVPKDLSNSNFMPKDLPNTNFVPEDLFNSNFMPKDLSNSNFVPEDLFNSNFMPKDLFNSHYLIPQHFKADFMPKNVLNSDLMQIDVCNSDFTTNTFNNSNSLFHPESSNISLNYDLMPNNSIIRTNVIATTSDDTQDTFYAIGNSSFANWFKFLIEKHYDNFILQESIFFNDDCHYFILQVYNEVATQNTFSSKLFVDNRICYESNDDKLDPDCNGEITVEDQNAIIPNFVDNPQNVTTSVKPIPNTLKSLYKFSTHHLNSTLLYIFRQSTGILTIPPDQLKDDVYNLGIATSSGRGMKFSIKKSLLYFEKGASLGHIMSSKNLEIMQTSSK